MEKNPLLAEKCDTLTLILLKILSINILLMKCSINNMNKHNLVVISLDQNLLLFIYK